LKDAEKWGVGAWEVKGKGRVTEEVEQTKVKYIHSVFTVKYVHPLNIHLEVGNRRQNCKIGVMYGFL
jgi:hypothetical protein